MKSRDSVKKFMSERGWDRQMPDHVAKSIAIEAAELLELFQWSNPKIEELKSRPEKLAEIKSELADVFVYAIQMSLILGLDIDEIVADKLVHAGKKYPAELMKLRFDGDSLAHNKHYLEIKKAYRRNKKKK